MPSSSAILMARRRCMYRAPTVRRCLKQSRRPGWDQPVAEGGATWLHYGANLGAVGGQLSLVSPADDLRELAVTELAGAGEPPDTVAPKHLVPSGETRDIHRAGGRYLTLVGSNPFFHLPQDRWPHAVDAGAVARIAAATAQDRKSTRLNSSHTGNSYAVFRLNKKTLR